MAIEKEMAIEKDMAQNANDDRIVAPPPSITALHLEERGFVPNNPRLPVLIYANAFAGPADDRAALIEECFARNGWPPQWRDGIYDFHHYHAQAHEVLGVARGEADLMLGGEGGRSITIRMGDALLLPAGTGHRRLRATDGFLAVGAYPPGQSADIRREAATLALRRQIARLSFPPSDPVCGPDGPLARHWSDTIAVAAGP